MGGLELPNRYNVAADLLDRNLNAGRGDKVAIYSAGGGTTYRELFGLACGAARTFGELGVRREERVLIVPCLCQ
jgi:benzoate-CoA ligase